MVYITVKQRPRYPQITFEDLFDPDKKVADKPLFDIKNGTITYERERTPEKFLERVNIVELCKTLERYNEATAPLRACPRESLYREYEIYKKSGGKRPISEPNPDLKNALYWLKSILENDFHLLHHTSAFAYVKERSTLDAIRRHQSNESKWFAKFDFHNFFGSTTLEFVMRMFSMIFPCSEIVKFPAGKAALETALSLAFLRGGLPQGSPVSPTITNIMMIPIDFALNRDFLNFERQSFVYTRYADDMQISSRYDFDIRHVQQHILDVLASFSAPFSLNQDKTRYGSTSGRNWNLGLMLNKDNEITIGSVKRRQFEAMVSSYIMDSKNGKPWPLEEVRHMDGLRNYYRQIEGEHIDKILVYLGNRFGVNVLEMIRRDLTV